MTGKLPKGWVNTTLGEIIHLNPKTDFDDELEASFIPMSFIPTDYSKYICCEIKKWADIKKGYTHFKNGDVIFAKITPCFENSKATIMEKLRNGVGAGSTEYYVLRSIKNLVEPILLLALVKSQVFLNSGEKNMKGSVGQKRVPKDFVLTYPFPLAPLNEQKRIAAKLNHIMSKIDGVKDRLDRIPKIIKRFRQSVLTAAVTGKLTEKWREENANLYSARNDIQKILQKKEQLLRNNRIKQAKLENTVGNKKIIEVLTETWKSEKIDNLFLIIDYRGKTPKKASFGKKLITAKNIRMGYLSDEPNEYVSEKTYKEWMTRGFPNKGDIFFVTEGATMGYTAINTLVEEFALAQRTLTLRPFISLDTRFFLFVIMSQLFQKLIQDNASGTAATGIKGAKFRNLIIPFPPLSEQRDIVRQVNILFALADKLEAHYNKAKDKLNRLPKSVLAQAFRGEMVTQDPSDEPAEKLLKRIKEEKTRLEIELKKMRRNPSRSHK